MTSSPHTKIITARYADNGGVRFTQYPPDLLVERYLSKLMSPAEFSGKTVLEIGAGCSDYTAVFLANGCAQYFANDLIRQRLAASRISDSRYIELPGDFLEITLPEPVDVVFACLTMMFVMPMLEEFIIKIRDSLQPGGHFISMDPNYLCPLSVYRRFADRKPNPARLFNPHRYAAAFRRHGFEVESLLPFTAPLPSTTGNWLLGTTFWMKARKK